MKRIVFILCCIIPGTLGAMSKIDVKRINTDQHFIHSVEFDRSGQSVLTNNKKLWGTTTGKCLLNCTNEVFARFDKRREILFAFLENSVKIFDPKDANLLLTLQKVANVTNAAINRKNTLIVTVGTDSKALLWDTDTEKCIRNLEGHRAAVTSALFFKRSPLVLTSSDDKTCKIWDLRQDQCTKTIEVYAPVKSSGVNRAENIIVSLVLKDTYDKHENRTQKTVEVNLQDLTKNDSGAIGRMTSLGGEVVFNRPTNRVTVASGRKYTWEVNLADIHSSIILKHEAKIDHIAMNKTLVATAGLDKIVKIWDTSHTDHGTWAKRRSKLDCKKCIGTLACDRGGSYVLAGLEDGTAKIWNINSGKSLQTCSAASNDDIVSSEFSRAGNSFAVGSHDGILAIGKNK